MPGEFHLSGTASQLVMGTPTAQQLAVLSGMKFTLTSNIPIGTQLVTTGGVYYLGPRTVTVLPSGEISENGTDDGIMLLAEDPDLGLDNRVQWTISPATNTDLGSAASVSLKSWTFTAPAPGVSRTLDQLAPVPNIEAVPVATMGIDQVTGFSTVGLAVATGDAAAGRAALGVSLVALEDIVWYDTTGDFPVTGVADEVYGARDTGKLYLWTGSSYVAARASVTTDDILDWSGTFIQDHNSGLNLLMDGSYEQDATWWAGEIARGGFALSTDHAYFGSQSFKITGSRTHYPNVTAAGKTGFDSTYGVFKADAGGRIYRTKFRVWRAAGNSSAGFIRARIRAVGAGGTDISGGHGPNDVVNQSDITTGVWTTYTNYLVVPTSGTNYPYLGVYLGIDVSSVGASDVFYIDTVEFTDLTDSPIELLAPTPTGNRTIDTANLQPLVNMAQTFKGTVLLRPGTYAADIVTAKLDYQPRIVGPGKVQCKIDGTIKMQGNSSKFSGGWLSGFSFTGSHAGQAALELNGVCDVHWDEIRVEGTYDVGIWFHNELSGDYAEVCNGTMDFYISCTTALKYTADVPGWGSFHGSGLIGPSCIQQSSSGPAVLIETNAQPYNAPLSARVWTSTNTYPVIQHNGSAQSNFFGNLTVEQIGTAALAAGTPIYYAGTLSAYMGPGLALSYGTLLWVAGVQAVSGGSISALALVLRIVQTVTTSVTLGAIGNYIVFIGASGAPTLPTAVGNICKYTFKNIDTASRIVSTTSAQTVEGLTSYTLPAGASIDVVSDGSNWRII